MSGCDRTAKRVMNAVMPKGVEHLSLATFVALSRLVMNAVMPKGVEHLDYEGRAHLYMP